MQSPALEGFGSLSLLARVANLMDESLVVTTANHDQRGYRIVFVNQAFCAMTGYEPGEVIGRTPALLQGPQTDRPVLAEVRAALVQGRDFDGRAINYRKNGEAFEIEWHIRAVRNLTGVVTHFFAVQRDVSREAELEARLERLRRAIEQIADPVVIFDPRCHVLDANPALASWTSAPVEESRWKPVWRLPGAPRNTRDFNWARHLLSRRRAWVRQYPSRLCLNGVWQRRLVQAHVTPLLNRGGGLIGFVALSQVLLGLLSNAISAVTAKPAERRRIRLSAREAPDRRVLIQVDDNGPGFPESDRERIFAPFFTTRSGGTGLGLAIARRLVTQMAPARAPVLLIGETGTGKSLAARTIHDLSGCRGPFVKVNCAAIPAGLIESELFGVERGAYTGATASRPGLFELADHGTLFLDEIGEVELAVQAKLLAVLEDGAARRVGGSRTIRFETRVVTATNRALAEAVDAGTFRADLYYRLDILRVEVPPLRTHPGDIAALCSLHLHRLGVPDTLAEGELARLERYAWPGNTRELFGILERAALLQTPPFEPSRFLDLAGPTPTGAPAEGPLLPLAEVEKQHILRVLDACGGHRQRSADVLGIGVATLQRRLREYAASEEVR